ncbi:MAG: site-specific DNA-methyltransferase, partial [Ruminococcaceae bacterium]|nr:site-specific DNA-methyltransferase [Oscillospiraceae bacterium]
MELNKIDGMSMDIEQTEMEKLKSVFPQCFAEGKLDIDKLLGLCGEYIDNDFEKYKFEWKGKMDSLKLAQKRSTGTLRPCKAESVNFDETQNLYIEGDNLEVLKLLQTAYYNKIKMIYIDPPYNTGNDFVYEDDFADPMARYKEVTSQTTKSNPETMGRYHTNWLNMMYPRLRLASNLLKEDGVIFISIDDNEAHNLKKLCDEVFGEENFVADMSVVNNLKGRNDKKYIARANERLLMYVKSMEFEEHGLSLDASVVSEYKESDNNGKFRLLELRKRGGPDTRKERPNMYYPFYVNPESGKVSLEQSEFYSVEALPVKSNGDDGRWRWGRETAAKNIDYLFGKQVGNKYNIYEKDYLEDGDGARRVRPKSVLAGAAYSTDVATKEYRAIMGRVEFSNPKPVAMIKDLIEYATNPNEESVILDFFSGSATLAHAVMQLNAEDGGKRRFICVQIPELCEEDTDAYKEGYRNLCEIAEERLRRTGKKILEENAQTELSDEEKKPLDVGFKVFKLDTSNLKKWDGTPLEETQIDMFYERLNSMIDTVKDDRTDMDVVYEIMLKMGIPLDVEVQYMEISDKIAYIVGDFILM